MRFDVIGDIHGEFDKLASLLAVLGYSKFGAILRHPQRTAVFVGDLIDRGPQQLETVGLVRGMVEAGAARCILGNHEFNAIAWVTPDPDRPGRFLRDHHKPGNRAQHEAFLDVVEGTPLQKEITDWFRTLPLWLDLGGLRVVHACWHEDSMAVLRPLLGAGQTLTDEAILSGSREGHPVFKALEVVCKGPEVPLPGGIVFSDKGGKVRHEVRVRWWQDDLSTYRKAAIGPAGDMEMIPDVPLPEEWRGHPYSGPPVLFGHYWFTGTPSVISPRFACLDYSVANGGPLVAYRWDGETDLSSEKLAWA
ncbi:MAG TPA: metallophosphoesterase [Steroidobacteraceae bacterium]|nr:metallophosphoesterase [Steroidobacteraceae bacterium]